MSWLMDEKIEECLVLKMEIERLKTEIEKKRDRIRELERENDLLLGAAILRDKKDGLEVTC